MAIMSVNDAQDITIVAEMKRDPNIFIYGYRWTTDCFRGSNPRARAEELGEKLEMVQGRIGYTGICENQMIGAGVGAALAGMRPIVSIDQTSFVTDGWGQLVLQAANNRFKLGYKLDCPVVFAFKFGNYNSGNGVHHSACYHNWIANSPGLFVAVPSTSADTVGLWRTALRDTRDPVVMLTPLPCSGIKGPVPDGDYKIPFGVADIKRQGSDVTIAAIGYMVNMALEAADDLAKAGINAEVWDPRTLTPLDRESLINSVRKTKALVIGDIGPKTFGATGELAISVAEAIYPIPPMARVAAMDVSIGFAPTLENYAQPNKKNIISAVQKVLGLKRG